MTARIPCCVPHCTTKILRDYPYGPDQEAICTVHMRPVNKLTRQRHRAIAKRAMAIMIRWDDPDNPPEAERNMALRYIKAEQWLWGKIKAQAIESAGGLR